MAKAQEKIEQDNRNCAFYMKTGCCRYGEACSKFHPYPEVSCTVLFRNMYTGIGMVAPIDEDGDVELQYDENEIMSHYGEFWKDVVPEFEKFGEIRVLRVCRNFSQHLRGNVYVTYTNEESAKKAAGAMNGRFYAGKPLVAEFSPIEDWKKALCGSSARSQCERGPNCNFLHVFRNPAGQYEGEEPRKRFEDDRRPQRNSQDRPRYGGPRRDDYRRDDRRRDERPDRRDDRRRDDRRDDYTRDDRTDRRDQRRRDDWRDDTKRDREDHKKDQDDRRKRRFSEEKDDETKRRRVDS